MAKLYIVCGHGDGDPGAGGYGYSEAERVRTLAAEMVNLAGDQVILGDTSINWYTSYQFQSFANPGCPVIELHMDSASPQARGAHVIIGGGLTPDDYDNALANWCASFFPGRSNLIVNRGDLRNPAICKSRGINYRLLECGFISSFGDLEIFNANITRIASDILACFGVSVSGGSATPAPVDDPVDLPPMPMVGEVIVRLYNPATGDHLYTDNQAEIDLLTSDYGWTNEGACWSTAPAIPVYRLYNKISGMHHFTADYHEAEELVNSRAWVFERIAWYASAEGMEVRRLYNNASGQHLLSGSPSEVQELTESGWTDEGAAFSALAVG